MNSPHMKILLIDDHVTVRKGIRAVLAPENDISIIEAQSSGEALELWNARAS
jgi:DNA-binding NarL/FixJ family response regulator